MGLSLTGRLLWVSSYSKQQWRRLFWRVRAAVRKASHGGRKGGSKHHLKFQYDPSSYALNFDDGCSKSVWEEQLGSDGFQIQHFNFQLLHSNPTKPMLLPLAAAPAPLGFYVFWVKI